MLIRWTQSFEIRRSPATSHSRFSAGSGTAEAFIDQHGEVYPLKDEKGKVKYLAQFPQVNIAANLAQHLTRLEQEFGLTPSARTRIQMPLTLIDERKATFLREAGA